MRPLVLVSILMVAAAEGQAASPPPLVVLTATGETRDGLPVLTRHPAPAATEAVLTRGFSGRLLRLYALEQELLRQSTGEVPEPAYLLLSDRRGGFPQFGFWLDDEPKPRAGWVDLHRDSSLSGQFGAVDQIFPHELFHVIVRQLAGEPRESGGNQVHAVGVRTDPVNAFDEGIAEHVQVLSVDDPRAAPETRALAASVGERQRADLELGRYVRQMSSRWRLVRPSQMRFLLWFSRAERVQRYHGVRANAFAWEPAVPDAVLQWPDKHHAYLLRSVMPGVQGGQPKPAAVMLSTEGVVAHLVWRWVTDPRIQARRETESFYARFGVRADGVAPLENAYLKLFWALHAGRPSDMAGLITAYRNAFPAEAPIVDRLVSEALLGQSLVDAPEIWLANPWFQTGTSLFDQYRGLPRPHTFDVNAATELDWLTVPGVTRETARRLLQGAPYASLDNVLEAGQDNAALRDRIREMAAGMQALRARAVQEEETLSIAALVRPYLWRLALILAATTIVGAWLARRVGVKRPVSAVAIGMIATTVVVLFAWLVTSPPWQPALTPSVVFGTPWAAWRAATRRSWRDAIGPWAVWAAASLPGILVSGLFW